MLIDFNNIDKTQKINDASIVIMGGGTSGIFLAFLLRKLNKKVIIIDKGKIPQKTQSQILFEKKKIKKIPYNKAFIIKNKFIGGWSNYWGGLLTELCSEDINKKYWGINFSQLTKLYDEIYNFFKLKIDRKILKKGNRNKSINNIRKYFCFYLKNQNFYYYFENFIKNSKNITYYYNCHLVNIVTKKNSVSSLVLINKNKNKFVVKANMFCLSMGVKGNNQFLLSLKKNKPNFLKKHKYIGKYLHDHIGIDVGNVRISNLKKFRHLFENGFLKKIKYQPKLFGRYDNLSMSAQFEDQNNFDQELKNIKNLIHTLLNLNFKKLNFSFLTFKSTLLFFRYLFHFLINKKIFNFFGDDIRLRIQSEQTVQKNNTFKIYGKRLYKENLLHNIEFNWKVNKSDYIKINKFTEKINQYLIKKNLGKIEKYNLSYKNFLKSLDSTYHLSGGTIISANIKKGVCNKNYKVWGVDNLYVTGSSLFPCNGSANTTLTILALTLRLSKILIKKNIEF